MCNEVGLSTLPALPATLEKLFVECNNLAALPTLPATLKVLRVDENELTALPELPATLEILDAGLNRLTALPRLPATLNMLLVNWNRLNTLPELPATLISLFAENSGLIQFPKWPATLKHMSLNTLYLYNDALTNFLIKEEIVDVPGYEEGMEQLWREHINEVREWQKNNPQFVTRYATHSKQTDDASDSARQSGKTFKTNTSNASLPYLAPNQTAPSWQPNAAIRAILTDLEKNQINPQAFAEKAELSNSDTRELLQYMIGQRQRLERVLETDMSLPAQLADASPHIQQYYHSFTRAFVQLHSSALVMDSGLFKMNSRAADIVAGANAAVSYTADAMKAHAAALPAPMGAVFSVVSNLYIHQRDSRVLNALNAFSRLIDEPHKPEAVARLIALNVCMQRKHVLQSLATEPRRSVSNAALPPLAERLNAFCNISIKQFKQVAQNANLMLIEHDTSPMALQALEDLSRMQAAALDCLQRNNESKERYLALQRTGTESDKVSFFLDAINLDQQDLRQIPVPPRVPPRNSRVQLRTASADSADTPELTPGHNTSVGYADLVRRDQHQALQQELRRLNIEVKELIEIKRRTGINLPASIVERGQHCEMQIVELRQKERDGLFEGCTDNGINIGEALLTLFSSVAQLEIKREDSANATAEAVEDVSVRFEQMSQRLQELEQREVDRNQRAAGCCTIA